MYYNKKTKFKAYPEKCVNEKRLIFANS